MKIKVNNEAELLKIAEEAIQVIANLRKFTKLWEESYGVELKNRKKCWEELADKFIERLQVIELKNNEHIKIEVNAD
jgi:CTP:phosphocholine cytidylyltransferase-like protein